MAPPDLIEITNGHQAKTMTWSELCWVWIGSRNSETIKRIRHELETEGVSHLIAVDGVGLALTLKEPA